MAAEMDAREKRSTWRLKLRSFSSLTSFGAIPDAVSFPNESLNERLNNVKLYNNF